MDRIRLGYSFWGFLGPGITDTPDGGRSHRLPLIRSLIEHGADLHMMQRDRDLLETGRNYSSTHLKFDGFLPRLDALFLEYRWPIPGRNIGVHRTYPEYTPDYERQEELLDHYGTQGIPILVWDKDLKLDLAHPLNRVATIFEACLRPRFGRQRLLFPVCPATVNNTIDKVEASYSRQHRTIPLIYVGNQYERDGSFKAFIDQPAAKLQGDCLVYGNWLKYLELARENMARFPNVRFMGKAAFSKLPELYTNALTTVLIAPERYYRHGQITQRLFESLFFGCIPLAPSHYERVEQVMIPEFVVGSPGEVAATVENLQTRSDPGLKNLLRQQLERLRMFDVNIQAQTILNGIDVQRAR